MQDYAWILGWDIQICRDAEDCRSCASTNRFDLFVADLDNRYPRSAFETLKALRRDGPSDADAPGLILVDGPIPVWAEEEAKLIGAAALRQKPLMLSDLKWVLGRFATKKTLQ